MAADEPADIITDYIVRHSMFIIVFLAVLAAVAAFAANEVSAAAAAAAAAAATWLWTTGFGRAGGRGRGGLASSGERRTAAGGPLAGPPAHAA